MGISIKDIEKRQPNTKSKNLLLRYAYIEILKGVHKDVDYFYEKNAEIRQEIYDKDINTDEEINEVICKTLIFSISRFCEDNNIKYKIIKRNIANEKKPHYSIIVEGDQEKRFFLDPMIDVFLIQLGMRTIKFGTSSKKDNVDILSREEIKQMDDELGYTYKGLYMDEIIEMMKRELSDKDELDRLMRSKGYEQAYTEMDYISFKLKYILEYFNQIPKFNGFIEKKMFYDLILRRLFRKEEREYLDRKTICRRNADRKICELKAYIRHKRGNEYEYYILENSDGKSFFYTKSIKDYMKAGNWEPINDGNRVIKEKEKETEK